MEVTGCENIPYCYSGCYFISVSTLLDLLMSATARNMRKEAGIFQI